VATEASDRFSADLTDPQVAQEDELGNVRLTIEQYLLSQLTAAILQRNAAAGVTIMLMDDMLRKLVSDINRSFDRAGRSRPLSWNRTSLMAGHYVHGVRSPILIAAAANGFRHMEEWLALRFDVDSGSYECSNEQRASIEPLLKCLGRTQISADVPFETLRLLATVATSTPEIRSIIAVMRAIGRDVFSNLAEEDAWEAAQSLKRPTTWAHDV
jgi:hypothetical protein